MELHKPMRFQGPHPPQFPCSRGGDFTCWLNTRTLRVTNYRRWLDEGAGDKQKALRTDYQCALRFKRRARSFWSACKPKVPADRITQTKQLRSRQTPRPGQKRPHAPGACPSSLCLGPSRPSQWHNSHFGFASLLPTHQGNWATYVHPVHKYMLLNLAKLVALLW